MKLNPNCTRDILIMCENKLMLDSNLSWNEATLSTFTEALNKFSREEIAYTLIILNEANLIDAYINEHDFGITDIYVYRLTYQGHEFLETIRPEIVFSTCESIKIDKFCFN